MIKLVDSLKFWATSEFDHVFKNEVKQLGNEILPLQQGLKQSSHVSDSEISVVILNTEETDGVIHIKTGIFYSGVIAGSCCSDDPTSVDEQTEYGELQFDIDKQTAETTVIYLQD